MQIFWNKRKRLHKKRVQFPEDWFGTPTWPPFHCFGTPIWPPWRHVKTLYRKLTRRPRSRVRILIHRTWVIENELHTNNRVKKHFIWSFLKAIYKANTSLVVSPGIVAFVHSWIKTLKLTGVSQNQALCGSFNSFLQSSRLQTMRATLCESLCFFVNVKWLEFSSKNKHIKMVKCPVIGDLIRSLIIFSILYCGSGFLIRRHTFDSN